MTVQRYILTSTVVVAAGAAATAVAGEPTTQNLFGSEPVVSAGTWPVTYQQGQPIMLDPAGPLYALIGAGNLKADTAAQETGGLNGTSN